MVQIRRKTQKEIEKEEERDLMRKIIKKYDAAASFPDEDKTDKNTVISREYKIFKEEEAQSKTKYTFFEKFCNFSEKISAVKMDEKSNLRYKSAIDFSGLRVTPTGVASFAVLAGLLLFLFSLIFIIVLPVSLPVIIILILLIIPFAVGFTIYNYPMNYANVLRIKTGGELVMGILYIIVYMRSTPNLEGAIRYAAENVSGKLSNDLKKVLWNVEIGKYTTVDEALNVYIMQWRDYNKEFIEAIQLIRESMVEMITERREILLDKAIDVVLTGTDEKMKKYSRDLETPVMAIHGLGIMLPVLGMIVFPLISIFLENAKGLGFYLFMGYDIILPLLVFYFMKQTLEKRPATHTSIDLSSHPGFAPKNNIVVTYAKEQHYLPIWPFALLVSVIGFLIALGLYGSFLGVDVSESTLLVRLIASPMFHSIIVVLSLAFGICVYYWGASFQKTALRSEVVSIESEFEDALFALGNRIHGGTPMEVALAEAYEDTKSLTISGLFKIALKNINMLSMTFKQSLFDERYGALRFYPSKLVRTIMKSISESVDKGTKAASLTMLTISRYLRALHTTQEKIDDILSSTTSSMRFQAYVLVPVISGVVVSVSQLIL